MSKIETTNKRICKFYTDNPTIQFDAINLMFIEFIEKLQIDMKTSISTAIQSHILSNMNENTKQLGDLKTYVLGLSDSISTLKGDITNGVILKLSDIKNDYINSVESIIKSNTLERVGPLLENSMEILIDKTKHIIEDVVPRGQSQYYSQIHDTIKTFHQSIGEDTNTLLKYLDNNSIKEYIQNFELKSSVLLQNVQQPIYSFISASEERLNSNINGMKETSSTSNVIQNKLLTELNDFLVKQKQPSLGFSNSESNLTRTQSNNSISVVLNQMFHTAEIINKNNGSVTMKRHLAKSKIVFHSKDDEMNITPEEISAFVKDVEETNCSGILLSHHSGITSKPNFHIDINRGNILVFVHHAEFSPEKIKMAIDIIDNLSFKLKELNTNDNHTHESCIPKEILDEINKEYQLFITQKEAIVIVFKESQRKVLSQIDELKFPSLEKFLSTKFSVAVPKHGFKCDLCTCFTGNNLKALAAHKRGCIKKQPLKTNTLIGSSINKENIPTYSIGNILSQ